MPVLAPAFGGGPGRLGVLAGGGGRTTLVAATVLGVGTVSFGGGALLGAAAFPFGGTGMRRDIVSHRRPVPVGAKTESTREVWESSPVEPVNGNDVPHLLAAECLAQKVERTRERERVRVRVRERVRERERGREGGREARDIQRENRERDGQRDGRMDQGEW